jgi:hypothetical protein
MRAASFVDVIGNPHAQGFYVSCGFCVTGTIETDSVSASPCDEPCKTTAE